MTEQQKPKAKETPRDDDAQQILRRLQGEDGYEIFADRRAADDHDRWLREYEDNRR